MKNTTNYVIRLNCDQSFRVAKLSAYYRSANRRIPTKYGIIQAEFEYPFFLRNTLILWSI